MIPLLLKPGGPFATAVAGTTSWLHYTFRTRASNLAFFDAFRHQQRIVAPREERLAAHFICDTMFSHLFARRFPDISRAAGP
eukprot:4925234-Pleurochrysis_carterae.AAC.1